MRSSREQSSGCYLIIRLTATRVPQPSDFFQIKGRPIKRLIQVLRKGGTPLFTKMRGLKWVSTEWHECGDKAGGAKNSVHEKWGPVDFWGLLCMNPALGYRTHQSYRTIPYIGRTPPGRVIGPPTHRKLSDVRVIRLCSCVTCKDSYRTQSFLFRGLLPGRSYPTM